MCLSVLLPLCSSMSGRPFSCGRVLRSFFSVVTLSLNLEPVMTGVVHVPYLMFRTLLIPESASACPFRAWPID